MLFRIHFVVLSVFVLQTHRYTPSHWNCSKCNDYTQMELRNERTFFLSFGMRLMALTLFLSVFHFFSLTNNLLFCCRVTMCTLHTLQLQLSKTNRRICHGRCNAMIKIHKRFEKWKRNFTLFGMATEKSSKRHTTIRRWEQRRRKKWIKRNCLAAG